jgi:hypothetical protein
VCSPVLPSLSWSLVGNVARQPAMREFLTDLPAGAHQLGVDAPIPVAARCELLVLGATNVVNDNKRSSRLPVHPSHRARDRRGSGCDLHLRARPARSTCRPPFGPPKTIKRTQRPSIPEGLAENPSGRKAGALGRGSRQFLVSVRDRLLGWRCHCSWRRHCRRPADVTGRRGRTGGVNVRSGRPVACCGHRCCR